GAIAAVVRILNVEHADAGEVGRGQAEQLHGCVARRDDRGGLVRVALPGAHLVVADRGGRDPIFQRLQERASPPRWRVLDRPPTTDGLHTEHEVDLPGWRVRCVPLRWRAGKHGVWTHRPGCAGVNLGRSMLLLLWSRSYGEHLSVQLMSFNHKMGKNNEMRKNNETAVT